MALIMVIFGVIILFASNVILSLFRVILGMWIIITAVMDLQTVLAWKQVKSPYWTVSLVLTMLMVLAGIIILVKQNIVITAVGAIIIVYGILDIIDRIIFIKKINDYTKEN